MMARTKLMRIYLDTSVIGGCLDEELRMASMALMRRLRDELSQEMEAMSPKERLHFIAQRAALSDIGKSLVLTQSPSPPPVKGTNPSPTAR